MIKNLQKMKMLGFYPKISIYCAGNGNTLFLAVGGHDILEFAIKGLGPKSFDMLSNARKISSRILHVSGRINGSSKFPIRSLTANKYAVQGHTAERHAQAVMPPRMNQQQPGNDPDLLPTWRNLFGAVVVIAVGCLSLYDLSKLVVRDEQLLLPPRLERSVASTPALDYLVSKDKFCPRLVHENKSAPFSKEPKPMENTSLCMVRREWGNLCLWTMPSRAILV
jgi:hypothetical protein